MERLPFSRPLSSASPSSRGQGCCRLRHFAASSFDSTPRPMLLATLLTKPGSIAGAVSSYATATERSVLGASSRLTSIGMSSPSIENWIRNTRHLKTMARESFTSGAGRITRIGKQIKGDEPSTKHVAEVSNLRSKVGNRLSKVGNLRPKAENRLSKVGKATEKRHFWNKAISHDEAYGEVIQVTWSMSRHYKNCNIKMESPCCIASHTEAARSYELSQVSPYILGYSQPRWWVEWTPEERRQKLAAMCQKTLATYPPQWSQSLWSDLAGKWRCAGGYKPEPSQNDVQGSGGRWVWVRTYVRN